MEAVTSYDEAKPDLILMDIKMPNLDGLEATKIIRELSHTVPIIAQSAYAYHKVQMVQHSGRFHISRSLRRRCFAGRL